MVVSFSFLYSLCRFIQIILKYIFQIIFTDIFLDVRPELLCVLAGFRSCLAANLYAIPERV
jgi:hypothetical protein